MDLRGYLDLLQRRWLILLLGPLVAGLGGLIVSGMMTPSYQASATVLVKPDVPEDAAAPGGDLLNFERFSNTYAALITSPTVLQAVSRQLDIPYDLDDLQDKVQAVVIEDTELIEIRATADDPALAANIANRLALTFNAVNPGRDTTPGTAAIVKAASRPDGPTSPNVVQNVLLAAAIGFMVAGLICFALESLDDSVKSPSSVESTTGLPTIAETRRIGAEPHPIAVQFRVLLQDSRLRAMSDLLGKLLPGNGSASDAAMQSPAFEPYRHLRTAIDSRSSSEMRVIAVTSPNAGEGKSTTATNLAKVLAHAGKKVVLVDADLRPTSGFEDSLRPARHFGLTGLLLNNIFDPSPALLSSETENLDLLPSGPLPENPAELLASAKTSRLLRALRKQADYVILDTSPALGASEAVWLAGQADAAILVAEARRTRAVDLQETARLMSYVNARILGVVLNKSPAKSSGQLRTVRSTRALDLAGVANGAHPGEARDGALPADNAPVIYPSLLQIRERAQGQQDETSTVAN